MATQSPRGPAFSDRPNNNGGTATNASPANDSPITQDLLLTTLAVEDGYGSTTVRLEADTNNDFSDDHGVIEANPNGEFNQNNENFIIRGAGPIRGGEINNSGTNLLTSPASEFAGTPVYVYNSIEGSERLGNPQFLFPILPDSGRNPGFIRSAEEGDLYDFVSTSGNDPAMDRFISAGRTVPGEVIHRTGAAVPVVTRHQPRDSFEQIRT